MERKMVLEKEKIEILKNLGFERVEQDQTLWNLQDYYGVSPKYVLNGKFGVAGDHAEDVAEFYYIDTLQKLGFYYSSSLFDTFYYGEHKGELDKIVEKLKDYSYDNYEIHSKKYTTKLTINTTSYTTWFIVECDLSNDFYAKACLEKLVKTSIVLDFLMQNYENAYYEKQKEDG